MSGSHRSELTHVAAQLRQHLLAYEQGLQGVRGTVIAAAPSVESLSWEQFQRGVASLDVAQRLPSLRGFGFIRRLPAQHEAGALDAALRIQGTGVNDGERFVLQYVEPLPANAAALGLDVASEPRQREALLWALRSGQAQLTAPITPMDTGDRGAQSFLLVLPVYRGTATPEPAQREAQGLGWFSAALVMEDVLQELGDGDGNSDLALALADVTDAAPQRFYASRNWQAGAHAVAQAVPLELFGRRWQLQMQASPSFLASLDLRHPGTVVAVLAALAAALSQLLRCVLQAAPRERVIRQQRAQAAAVVDSAASAIIATDLAGHITAINPAAEALLRLNAGHARGCSLLDFLDAQELQRHAHLLPREVCDNSQQLPEPLRQAMHRDAADANAAPTERRERHRGDWTCVRADDTRFSALLTMSVLRNGDARPMGFMFIITDLTERKAMEEALRQRTAQAEAASRAKSSFLANMSHELRTPLNAIIGLSDLLARMELPPMAMKYVEHVREAGGQLLGLTDDVLDLSRIEAGAMRLERMPFELPPLLQAVLAVVQPQADAKGLRLRLDAVPDLPQVVLGDPMRLKQVLLNLLGNAVKFTPAGSVTLRARLLAHEGRTVRMRLDVVDTGIGIAPEQQQHIFEPFTQADDSITRRAGGAGLGLSIVRRLVAMMGGELVLHSMPYQGSTFSVTVRFQVPAVGGAGADTS